MARKKLMGAPSVERAVAALSQNHWLDQDTDYIRRDGGSPCDLVTTNESHWVAAFCEYILRKVCAGHPKATFNRFFEIPSLDSEVHERAGYDLSAGPFDTNNRYRFMHKTALQWCDRNWSWHTEVKNDRKHLAAILGKNHSPLARHKTYFVLHVFRCIHDWRRMGLPFIDGERDNEEYHVPDFPSLLRTIIVPLDTLKGGYDDSKWVRIERKAPEHTTGPAQGYLTNIESPDFIECEIGGKVLAPITLDDLCNRMAEEWKPGGMWEKSIVQ
jgi:hypothetical protein